METTTPANLDNVNAVVIDIGSETIRAGYCFSKVPQFEIDSIGGIQRLDEEKYKTFFGPDIRTPLELMKLNPVVYDGLIKEWDLFEKVMNMINSQLQCNPKETFYVFSESLLTTEKVRQKLLELMFEKIGCNGIYIKPSAVFQLASRYLSSGCVIDSGASHTSVTPVSDYYALKESYWKADVGGNFLVDQASDYFLERGEVIPPQYASQKHQPKYKVSTTLLNWSIQETIKECVQSIFRVHPTPLPSNFTYYTKHVFSNKKVLLFDKIVYELPEGLFDRKFDITKRNQHSVEPSITYMIDQVLENADPSIKYYLRQHVLVTGGNSKLPGFYDRISYHLNKTYYGAYMLEPSTNPKYDAYHGAANFVRMPDFFPLWYSSKQYADGDRSIHEL